MTSQVKDTFVYLGKPYSLFDVSDNKVLTCKNCVGEAFGGIHLTCCYRESIATYEVKDGLLYLKETAATDGFTDAPAFFASSGTEGNTPTKPRANPGTLIPFTGHVIIGQTDRPMDFFSSILDADEAFELEFDEGTLVKTTDMREFIEAGNTYKEQMPKSVDGCYEDLDFFHDVNHMIAIMSSLSPVIPRGNYSNSSYVWRDDSECVLCKSLEASSE